MNTSLIIAVSSVFVLVAAITTAPTTYAWIDPDVDPAKAPALISGDNVYVVWWTDKNTPNSNGGNRLNITASPFGIVGSAAEEGFLFRLCLGL